MTPDGNFTLVLLAVAVLWQATQSIGLPVAGSASQSCRCRQLTVAFGGVALGAVGRHATRGPVVEGFSRHIGMAGLLPVSKEGHDGRLLVAVRSVFAATVVVTAPCCGTSYFQGCGRWRHLHGHKQHADQRDRDPDRNDEVLGQAFHRWGSSNG